MEAVERSCGMFQGDRDQDDPQVVDFPTGDAIASSDILLLSDAQLL